MGEMRKLCYWQLTTRLLRDGNEEFVNIIVLHEVFDQDIGVSL
jgi:hypothetical protein